MFSRLLHRRPFALRWPSQCAVCHSWQAERLCEPCLRRFVPQTNRCVRCALRLPDGPKLCGECIKQPPPYEFTVAALDYDHPWDGLLHALKFRAALDLAPTLAARLQHAVETRLQPGIMPRPDLLLPTPLHPARLRERGHNPAWELARRLAAPLGLCAESRLLLRIKDTPHQLALTREQRRANMRDAFALEPARRSEVAQRSVAIVDDVMTSGATAAEMARTLLQAGASSVQIWVLARTALE
ncbi:MAG TPA: ComF family protein [Methylibium sp.]